MYRSSCMPHNKHSYTRWRPVSYLSIAARVSSDDVCSSRVSPNTSVSPSTLTPPTLSLSMASLGPSFSSGAWLTSSVVISTMMPDRLVATLSILSATSARFSCAGISSSDMSDTHPLSVISLSCAANGSGISTSGQESIISPSTLPTAACVSLSISTALVIAKVGAFSTPETITFSSAGPCSTSPCSAALPSSVSACSMDNMDPS
mmetsp:Transcript_13791/g.50227  ORF Transcript_13791/g.50227 Transcript_13791/m.50227 type:complete len:205 (+) Transcript_13791:1392-2006(+)